MIDDDDTNFDGRNLNKRGHVWELARSDKSISYCKLKWRPFVIRWVEGLEFAMAVGG